MQWMQVRSNYTGSGKNQQQQQQSALWNVLRFYQVGRRDGGQSCLRRYHCFFLVVFFLAKASTSAGQKCKTFFCLLRNTSSSSMCATCSDRTAAAGKKKCSIGVTRPQNVHPSFFFRHFVAVPVSVRLCEMEDPRVPSFVSVPAKNKRKRAAVEERPAKRATRKRGE